MIKNVIVVVVGESGGDNVVGEGRGGGGGGGEGVEGVGSRIYPLVVCFWYSRRGRSQGDHLLCSAGHSFVFLLHHAPPQIEKRPPHTSGVRKVTSLLHSWRFPTIPRQLVRDNMFVTLIG